MTYVNIIYFLDNFNDAKKRIKKLMRLYMVWEILPVLDINLHPIAVDLTLIFVLNLETSKLIKNFMKIL